MNQSKTIEQYISNNQKWKEALQLLHDIVISTQLQATIKWGSPVYTLNNKNVVGIGGFKSYVGIWFYQGALLQDKEKKLINAQVGVTKALRQWRFNTVQEIDREAEKIKAYLQEAISNQTQGKVIKPVKNKPITLPDELVETLNTDPDLSKCFETFALSKKREFCEHIAQAKRPATKLSRLEKIKPLILKGEGLNDKYRKKP